MLVVRVRGGTETTPHPHPPYSRNRLSFSVPDVQPVRAKEGYEITKDGGEAERDLA